MKSRLQLIIILIGKQSQAGLWFYFAVYKNLTLTVLTQLSSIYGQYNISKQRSAPYLMTQTNLMFWAKAISVLWKAQAY
jgi:hypothetical protein